MWTYYDNALGRVRFKRRYVWALCAFLAGLTLGITLDHLM